MECKLIFSWKMNSHNVILHIVHFFIVLDVVQQTYLNDNDTIMAITCVKWQCNLLLNSNWLLCLSILQLFSWIGLLMIYHMLIVNSWNWVDGKQVGESLVTTTILASQPCILASPFAWRHIRLDWHWLLYLPVTKSTINTPTLCM
jgi:hypothetical protein